MYYSDDKLIEAEAELCRLPRRDGVFLRESIEIVGRQYAASFDHRINNLLDQISTDTTLSDETQLAAFHGSLLVCSDAGALQQGFQLTTHFPYNDKNILDFGGRDLTIADYLTIIFVRSAGLFILCMGALVAAIVVHTVVFVKPPLESLIVVGGIGGIVSVVVIAVGLSIGFSDIVPPLFMKVSFISLAIVVAGAALLFTCVLLYVVVAKNAFQGIAQLIWAVPISMWVLCAKLFWAASYFRQSGQQSDR